MSIGEQISVRPSRAASAEIERIDLGSAPAPALDRLFADTDLLLAARALLVRATSPLNRSAGRSILADRIASLLAASPSLSANRSRLEVFAVSERLLDPIARLTAEVDAPLHPTISWAAIAPDATLELERGLALLRDQIEAPHLASLFRLLDALLHASNETQWAAVEALAVEQNARALASEEPVVLFASLFWSEQGTAWPAIYLVEKSPAASCRDLERVALFFQALDRERSAPELCFATNLIFAPSKAHANAFALHNQAALIFEVVDAERRARFACLASMFELDVRQCEAIGRVFLAGHEFGHKYDPLNLPKWTEELFADVAAIVACASVLEGTVAPGLLLRVLLVEALSNYTRPAESVLYYDSSDQILARLAALGAIALGDSGEVIVDVDAERWAAVAADFSASWAAMRAGRLPEHFRRGAPCLMPLRRAIARVISSERS